MTALADEPISSTENTQVKLARSLLDAGRRKHSAFLVEGVRLVKAAVARQRHILRSIPLTLGRVTRAQARCCARSPKRASCCAALRTASWQP